MTTGEHSPNENSLPSQPARHDGTESPQVPCIDSAELFRGRREITIRHEDGLYRLRITKSGKLILHK